MAAYVVQVRVDRIRVVGRRARGPATGRTIVADPRRSRVRDVAGDPIEIIGAQPLGHLESRWARVCELWSQTTFYLFDAESWRR
jgi:hypothetical protein